MKESEIVVGAQWGDEGKGKVVDAKAAGADAVVRVAGGPNAGHTIYVDGKKVVLHQLPVGVVRKDMMNVVGPYVVCDPEEIQTELKIAEAYGSHVMIDRSAPLILPIHKQIDRAREVASGSSAIGTTGRGIGPCYEDFASRRGPSIGDLESEDRFADVLLRGHYYDEREAIVTCHGGTPMGLDETVAWGRSFSEMLRPHLGDTREMLGEYHRAKGKILFEGAQGVMLDVLHGARPYCTSSSCGSSAVGASFGIHGVSEVLGVAKAYATRVGSGPFPTELDNSTGELLRERGNEYGATTGRSRRCGWLDLPALRYARRVGGISAVVLTKLDILSNLPEILIAESYALDGAEMREMQTLTADVLSRVIPRYRTFKGWEEDLRGLRKFDDLPMLAYEFVNFIEITLQLIVVGVSVGPGRDDMVWRWNQR